MTEFKMNELYTVKEEGYFTLTFKCTRSDPFNGAVCFMLTGIQADAEINECPELYSLLWEYYNNFEGKMIPVKIVDDTYAVAYRDADSLDYEDVAPALMIDSRNRVGNRHLLVKLVTDGKYQGNTTYFYISDEKTVCYSVDSDDMYGQRETLEICRYGEKPPLFKRCVEWLFGYFSDDCNLAGPGADPGIATETLKAICVDEPDFENIITDSDEMIRRYYSLFDDPQNMFATGDVPLVLAYLMPEKQWPWPVADCLSERGIDANEVPCRVAALLNSAAADKFTAPCGILLLGSYPSSQVVAGDEVLQKLHEMSLKQPDSDEFTVDGQRYLRVRSQEDSSPGSDYWFEYVPVSWTAFPNGEEVDLISDRVIDMMPLPDEYYADSYMSDVFLNRSVQRRLFSEAEKKLLIPGGEIVLEQEPNYFDSEGNFIEELFSPEVLEGYLTQPSISNIKNYRRQESMACPIATGFAAAAGTTLKYNRIATISDAFVLPDDAPMCGIRPMIRMTKATFAEVSEQV